jgi:hypothetical protein
MDTLHTVLRSIRGETKARRDHISVFREFLDHLGRISRARAKEMRDTRRGNGNTSARSARRGKS